MYLTIMYPAEAKVTSYALDGPVDFEDKELFLSIVEALGYHTDEIFYMLSIEEPYMGSTEISDVLPNFKIE